MSLLSFKSWLNHQLSEELSTQQKFAVNMVAKRGTHIGFSKESDAFFHPDNKDAPGRLIDEHTRVIPFATPHKVPHSIADYLDDVGYDIHDYKAGLAKNRESTSNNTIKIGRILSKPHPTPHMEIARQGALADFIKDEKRGEDRTDEHEIMITRHPHRVAEMSTNKPWSSCVDIGNCKKMLDGDHDGFIQTHGEFKSGMLGDREGGTNAHYIPREINAGTHAAYLIKKGDHTLRDPIARIKILPYHNVTSGHTAYVPSRRLYADGSSALHDVFKDKLGEITSKHIGVHPSTIEDTIAGKGVYTRNRSTYSDGDPDVTGEMRQEAIEKIRGMVKSGAHVPDDHIKYFIKHGEPNDHHDILDRYGKNLSIDHQVNMATYQSVGNKMIDMYGQGIHPRVQDALVRKDYPSVLHKLVDIVGKNMNLSIQHYVLSPTMGRDTLDMNRDKFDVGNKLLKQYGASLPHSLQMAAAGSGHGRHLIDTFGKDLHPDVLHHALVYTPNIIDHDYVSLKALDLHGENMPSVMHLPLIMNRHHEKLINAVGKKLDPKAQMYVRKNIPHLRSLMIKNMGKHLHPDVAEYMAEHSPHLHDDLLQHVGDALTPKARQHIDEYKRYTKISRSHHEQ